MLKFTVLQRNWKEHLASLLSTAEAELLISSPYISHEGTDFVAESLSPNIRAQGQLTILTDLSPINICQGATDPRALESLTAAVPSFRVCHLPRLHAKVYVADSKHAIITSGNLTAGGLTLNYEYGVKISEASTVGTIRSDIMAYAALGATVDTERLTAYCQITDKVRATFRRKQIAVGKSVRQQFEQALRHAADELIRLQLAGGAVHTIFARTILYLLNKHGALTTRQLHPLVEAIHPDLCDNSVDRVIDGERFGKKWKHAVRTAQQNLKKRGLIYLADDHWMIMKVNKAEHY
ncbi:phospholipase D-like domain-containing protein [Candidatus Acetothermia bacterium]|jgi:hypothetical protein|nr:phospholipase D-like domain-containing protein [Candidatus Acetothermia bacterium]MCI2432383.1 phospholipase D-like domain-containing protein [Candidatus Acetothermia bacterium]MCI2437227.1 phospholipase D-like domain-containing protein [Candidatus Acetothermia bacterium]